MNGKKYHQILKEIMSSSARKLEIGRANRKIDHTLAEGEKTEHPQSLELNPIEDMWRNLKIGVHQPSASNLIKL